MAPMMCLQVGVSQAMTTLQGMRVLAHEPCDVMTVMHVMLPNVAELPAPPGMQHAVLRGLRAAIREAAAVVLWVRTNKQSFGDLFSPRCTLRQHQRRCLPPTPF